MNRFPFKRVSLALSIVALMAGCSSGVKLDDVPVEDRGATSTAPGANSGSTGQSGVAPVDLSQSGRDAAGPVGVARVIYFDFDSFIVKPEFQSVLEAHARFMKASSARKVVLEAIPMSAVAASTTWRWARSARKPCAARWGCWACRTRRWRR